MNTREEFVETKNVAGAATPTKEKRFLTPNIIKIRKDEQRLSDSQYAGYEARQAQKDVIKLRLADLYLELNAAEAAAKRDDAVEKRIRADIAEAKAELASIDPEAEERRKQIAGSVSSFVERFIDELGKKVIDVGTEHDPIAPGTDPRVMQDDYRKRQAAKRAELKATTRAPKTQDEIMGDIAGIVERAGASFAATFRAGRSVNYSDDVKRFYPGSFELPTVAVTNGVGGVTHVPDGIAFACATDPDGVKDKLYALALRGHDENKALSMSDRMDKVATIEAEILEIERKSEALVRYCFKHGLQPGPRITSNPFAILDCEYA